jgi:hypothetical protein
MIRRGFWLAAGAALGVAGYRRATRLARGLGLPVDGRPAAGQAARSEDARQVRGNGNLAGRSRHAVPARRRGVIAGVASAALFARDVREGMAEYWSQHRGELARTLEGRGDRIASGGSDASEQRTSGR